MSHYWIPQRYLTNFLAVPSADLCCCSSCHPTSEGLQNAHLQEAKRAQLPLPSVPVVWVHTAAEASLPLCSQRHRAVCKLGAERPHASSHPADSPGTAPGPRTHTSVIKLRFYSASPQDGRQEHSSAQWSSNTSQPKHKVQHRPPLSLSAQRQLPMSSGGASWHLLCIPQQMLMGHLLLLREISFLGKKPHLTFSRISTC